MHELNFRKTLEKLGVEKGSETNEKEDNEENEPIVEVKFEHNNGELFEGKVDYDLEDTFQVNMADVVIKQEQEAEDMEKTSDVFAQNLPEKPCKPRKKRAPKRKRKPSPERKVKKMKTVEVADEGLVTVEVGSEAGVTKTGLVIKQEEEIDKIVDVSVKSKSFPKKAMKPRKKRVAKKNMKPSPDSKPETIKTAEDDVLASGTFGSAVEANKIGVGIKQEEGIEKPVDVEAKEKIVPEKSKKPRKKRVQRKTRNPEKMKIAAVIAGMVPRVSVGMATIGTSEVTAEVSAKVPGEVDGELAGEVAVEVAAEVAGEVAGGVSAAVAARIAAGVITRVAGVTAENTSDGHTTKVGLATPKSELGTPKLGLATPEVGLASPKVELATPKVGLATPKKRQAKRLQPSVRLGKLTR